MPNASQKIDLKAYTISNEISDTQTNELIYSKVSQCADIKSVTPNPSVGIASLTGRFYKYIIEHKHEKIHVRPKINYGISVVLSAFSLPFALWFMYAFDWVAPFKQYAIPLSLLLISFGVVWFIGYTLGDKEQKSILSYIYNVLTGNPANKQLENTKSVGANKLLAIIPFLIGIALLVLFFVL